MKLAGKGKATGDNDKRIPCILKGQTLDDVSNWVFYPLNPIANILHKIKCQSRNQIF